MVPAPVKVFHHVAVGRYVNARNAVLIADVRNALHGVFIEGIERKLFYFQFHAPAFYLVDGVLDTCGTFLLAFALLFTAIAVVDDKAFAQVLPLLGRETLEPVEVGIVIFRDDVLYQAVFRLGNRSLRPFPDEQHKIFQKACFLHVHLLPVDAERIHRDRLFLCI